MSSLPERMARAIALAGPIPLSQFMAAANGEYYATRDPLGAAGDFITAPEISQMFGELVGAWLGDLWQRAGAPAAVHYVELGPGRGTLARDALRMLHAAGCRPIVHLVETSHVLRASQATRLPDAQWHDTVATLPDDAPVLVVANEFFDALPIEQLIADGQGGWRQRLVACQDTLFVPIAGKPVPPEIVPERLRDAPAGAVIEVSPAGVGVVRRIAKLISHQGGGGVVIDYGHASGPAVGDTLQAVRGHRSANPFEAPGSVDLSAHVDFATLAAAAIVAGVRVHGPVTQRDWLGRLGLAQRAAILNRAQPERGDEIGAAAMRLTSEDAMGTLFKVLGLTAPGWPDPAGFAS
jgi:NADH dehydrogenase [ubiquinone] 1 alpha subcomplex assembly factor 7